MKRFEYKYNFEPEMYKYILSTNILNKKKDEHLIFKSLVAGYSAKEIGKRYHYAKTIGEFAEEYPYGKYAISTNGHLSAILNGCVIDTFDPRNRVMRCAWRIG